MAKSLLALFILLELHVPLIFPAVIAATISEGGAIRFTQNAPHGRVSEFKTPNFGFAEHAFAVWRCRGTDGGMGSGTTRHHPVDVLLNRHYF